MNENNWYVIFSYQQSFSSVSQNLNNSRIVYTCDTVKALVVSQRTL